ncbi:hypothetical protein E1287_37730 [Actinomadura sp. KC06]|uniref:hypothetical protein n=1 Tax=Actinomadura sp. KC06 TaxID=2530369 RepID=UPI001048285F|nr:hypothetical protein [Actinomadura sp. KC06]TDD25004.1 hypothetical protein E1287_37730 [Actinomadura sp. KC06]
MTDQTPDLDATIAKSAATIRDAFEPLADAVREAWDKIRPILQATARDGETQTAAVYALAGAFEEDEADVSEQLVKLDADQLRDVIAAANLLAEKAALASLTASTDGTDQ